MTAFPTPEERAHVDEVYEHLAYVLNEKLRWTDATSPEVAKGAGHYLIRFERRGQRYVFRVAKHGLVQHRRTMLAYRHAGPLGVMPEKVYHDGVCVLERHAEGAPITAQVSERALQSLAQALSQLHATPAQGFGPLDHGTQGSFADAHAFYQARSKVELDWSEMDVSRPQTEDLHSALADANRMPADVNRLEHIRLGHGDLWRSNVFVTDREVTLIDWDRIGAYPLERDLAFLWTLGLSEAQLGVFFAHYTGAQTVRPHLLRWFARRQLLRDRALRLDQKWDRLRALDAANLPQALVQS